MLARFQHACQNFRNNISGFGVIEAAFTLPIFLGLTFAVIDYGLMMSNRSSTVGSISGLARTIQDNPGISAVELNALVVNAGGGNVNFTTTGNCFCAKSFGDQASAQAFVNGAGCSDAACSSGGRNTGTGTPRYIGVRGQVTYKFITPVNKIFVGSNTKVLKFGQVVPVGITVCPAGEALTSAGVCAASTITCGAGQFLTASGTCSAAVPVCNGAGKALQFDGANWSCVNSVPQCTVVYGATGDAYSYAQCPADFPYLRDGHTECQLGDYVGTEYVGGSNAGYATMDWANYTNNTQSSDCASKSGGGSYGRAVAVCCKVKTVNN